MLRRDIALARRNQTSLHLLLFAIPELETYRRTFGAKAADSCLRMIGAQITGTFRRASDLCARVDETTIAVAALGQDDEQAARLVAVVEMKTRNLGLHNPRGRLGKHVVVRGAWTSAEPASDDIERLFGRARAELEDRSQTAPSPLEPA